MRISKTLNTIKPRPYYESIRNKALVAIEYITIMWDGWSDKEKMLEEIYKFSHLAIGDCDQKHKEWEKTLIDFYNKIHKEEARPKPEANRVD